MNIEKLEVFRVALRCREPFRIALPKGAKGRSIVARIAEPFLYRPPLKYVFVSKSQNIIVRMVTDQGVNGLGAASPSKLVTGETTESIIKVLDKVGPKLIGICGSEIEKNVELIDTIIHGNPAAKAALDMAFHDMWGKAAGKPLYNLIGDSHKEVITDRGLGIKSPKEMARDAVKAVEDGFKALKIKVGLKPGDDIERVRLIRKAVGDDIQLRVDANQGWTRQQTIEVLRKIEKFKIQFVEQPVHAEDIEGMKEIRKNSSIPIMADESVKTLEDTYRVIQAEAADLINIKLMKSAGIWKAQKIADMAETAGIPCMIGCGIESRIGITAGVHVAAATENIHYVDLDSDFLLKDKLVIKGGVPLKAPTRHLPSQSGLGIELLDKKLLGEPVRLYT